MKTKTNLLIVAAVLLFGAGCATTQRAYHGYLMKGHIVSADGNEVYLCVGTKDGATAGQELKVYRVEPVATGAKGSGFRKVDAGIVKIESIVDEHFAKATVVSGKVAQGYIVELEN